MTEASHYSLHLDGLFELNLGENRIVRGEGSTTIKLDQADVEKLRAIMDEKLDETTPMVSELLSVIQGLPETLRTTSEILSRLSDPETQSNLRQVEQLLRLMQKTPGTPKAK